MTTLYQKKRTGKIWQWSIEAKGSIVTTSYGYVDGAIQSTQETALAMNIGKANEIEPSAQAKLIAERHIKDKLDNGYVRTIEEAENSIIGEVLDFTALPKSFCPAKPITSIEPEKLKKLWALGNLEVHRKFDGMCHFVVRSLNGVDVFSRSKLEQRKDHVPHIVQKMMHLPLGTILNGELCSMPNQPDNFKHVSSVLRTKDPEKAKDLQRKNGILHYIVFDVLYWEGQDLSDIPYSYRMKNFRRWLARHADNGSYSMPVDLAETYTYDQLFGKPGIASKMGWEGLVVWDGADTTEIRFDGKEGRRNCYKVKTVVTEDIWATDPRSGKGKHENRLGNVAGWQYNPAGELVSIGDVGGGFTEAERDALWASKEKSFPCAIEVETPERIAGSLKLRFPIFVRLRPDKKKEECRMQLLPRGE